MNQSLLQFYFNCKTIFDASPEWIGRDCYSLLCSRKDNYFSKTVIAAVELKCHAWEYRIRLMDNYAWSGLVRTREEAVKRIYSTIEHVVVPLALTLGPIRQEKV